MDLPTDDDARLLGWLCNNGVEVVTSFGIDVNDGRVGPARFSAPRIDLPRFKAALAALVKPYQEHIDADHEALREVWQLHTSGADYCPEDGFTEPCRTKRTITGELPRE